ncbi:hypothetical protein [Microbulbifer sp. YPW16]|uniref:hypothetical protein n=1 Tax=Microbulbifer sp. YPW16 TaxID=2904242 RepID=UPI001E3DB95C|nr:hypothetical protein [Microbulbifer sp. YPW16]UHQ56292.1 hypothetical protein LVE68_04730 [Microbulbifer sp. YPW16]
MRPLIPLIVTTAILGATGCTTSSTANDRAMREFFNTQISDNGSKQFEYTMHIKPPERRDRGKEKGMGGSNRAGMQARAGEIREKYEEQMNLTLQEGARAKLAETGYCPEGYMELERTVTRGRLSLRGECRDGAPAEGREQLPNPAVPDPGGLPEFEAAD